MNSMEKLYDLAQLNAVAAGSEDFMKKMIEMFLNMTPGLVERVENGLAIQDWDEVQKASHKMKPSIDMMGISSLHETVRTIEQNAKHQTNLELISPAFDKLKSTLATVFEQLRDEI